MVGYSWFRANNVSGLEYITAKSLLMSGPKATPPTFRAVRKMIGRLRRGDKPGQNGYSSWRSARKVYHAGSDGDANVAGEAAAD